MSNRLSQSTPSAGLPIGRGSGTELRVCPKRLRPVVLRRLPVEEYSKDELGLIFWAIGTHLGTGVSQSVMGDRLGHVNDFSR